LATGGIVQATGSGTIFLGGNVYGRPVGINSTGTPGLIKAGSGTVILNANVIDLTTDASGNPTVTSTEAGQLVFEPPNILPIVMGGSDVAGSLVYSDADNAAIAQGGSNGFNLITLNSGSGTMATAKNVTFGANAALQTFTGNIVVSNTLKAVGGTLTLKCNSKITTAGGGQLRAHN